MRDAHTNQRRTPVTALYEVMWTAVEPLAARCPNRAEPGVPSASDRILARSLGASFRIPVPLQAGLLPRLVLGAHPGNAAIFPLVTLLHERHGRGRRPRAQLPVPGSEETHRDDDSENNQRHHQNHPLLSCQGVSPYLGIPRQDA
jgi:hypothetical protein